MLRICRDELISPIFDFVHPSLSDSLHTHATWSRRWSLSIRSGLIHDRTVRIIEPFNPHEQRRRDSYNSQSHFHQSPYHARCQWNWAWPPDGGQAINILWLAHAWLHMTQQWCVIGFLFKFIHESSFDMVVVFPPHSIDQDTSFRPTPNHFKSFSSWCKENKVHCLYVDKGCILNKPPDKLIRVQWQVTPYLLPHDPSWVLQMESSPDRDYGHHPSLSALLKPKA
jgi:hypothetical protein